MITKVSVLKKQALFGTSLPLINSHTYKNVLVISSKLISNSDKCIRVLYMSVIINFLRTLIEKLFYQFNDQFNTSIFENLIKSN